MLTRPASLHCCPQSGPETIAVKDMADGDLWWAAEHMEGFSGARGLLHLCCARRARGGNQRKNPPALAPPLQARRALPNFVASIILCHSRHSFTAVPPSRVNALPQAVSWPSSWPACRPWPTAPTMPS